ncbi:Ral GTPase-activating protein subunit alpha-2, partial [Modicella reniformis]
MSNTPLYYCSDRGLIGVDMDGSTTCRTTPNDIQTTLAGNNTQGCGHETQRIFALNDTILISLEEVPSSGPTNSPQRTRVVIRDETGRYAWDSEIFYREMLQAEESGRPQLAQKNSSRMSERFGSNPRRRKKELASQLVWRGSIKIREDEDLNKPKAGASTVCTLDSSQVTAVPLGLDALVWDGASSARDGDMLNHLLYYIGDKHPDCLFDGKTPLNQMNNGMALSTEPGHDASQTPGNSCTTNGVNRKSTIDFELDRHVHEETFYSRISDPQARAWYDKLVELRSSLIQADDDIDESYGSSTFMSLVGDPSWKAFSPQEQHRQQQPQTFPEGSTHQEPLKSEAPNRSNRFSWRRGRLEDVREACEEATGLDKALVGRDENQDQRSSLIGSLHDRVREENEDENEMLCGVHEEDASNMAKAFQLVLPPEPERPLDCYQHSRLLLSHLGLLYFDRFQEHNFVLLNQSSNLVREIINLDRRSGRETFKIALLFVAAGQEGEQAILRNSRGSAAYNRFVQDLGWEVDLTEHSGYMGGLERNGSNGQTAIYYCSSTCEVIFHEVVRMPTEPEDRQLKKKRHVGNDHVHIVWSEHSRSYDRNTIGGDFGNVIIVLTPLLDSLRDEKGELPSSSSSSSSSSSGIMVHEKGLLEDTYGSCLVSVEVIRDNNLPVFGPLVDGMVVPMSQLGRLVRQTVIHAARLATAPPPLPPTPSSAGIVVAANANANAIGAAVGTLGTPTSVIGAGGGMTGFMGGTAVGTTTTTTTITTISGVGSGSGAGGGTGVQLGGYRAGGYQTVTGSTMNSMIQGYPPLPPSGNSTAVANGYGSTVAGTLSTTALHMAAAAAVSGAGPSAMAGGGGGSVTTTTTATTTAHLAASVTNLGNLGTGSNAASVVSLISNSGSVHGGAGGGNGGGTSNVNVGPGTGIGTGTGGGGSMQYGAGAGAGPLHGGLVTANGFGSTSTLASMTANANTQQQ